MDNLKIIHIGGYGKFGKLIYDKVSSGITTNITRVSSDENYKRISYDDVDWVIISTPNELHYEQAKWILTNTNCHVFVEKPCTLSYETTKELFDLASNKNQLFYVDDIFVYDEILPTQHFIYKKWSDDSNNIIDRIAYHHLYSIANSNPILYNQTDVTVNVTLNTKYKLVFDLLFNDITYSFDYDLNHIGNRVNNCVTNTTKPIDPLTNMLTHVFNKTADFVANKKRTLWTTLISDKIKLAIYGKTAVVGAGIYGCTIATKLRTKGYDVTLIEREQDILKCASDINQYRLHRGYHYPRSSDTINDCKIHQPEFVKYYNECVMSDINHTYAIASSDSMVSAIDYLNILDTHDLEWKFTDTIPNTDVTIVANENLFDVDILRDLCKIRLHGNGVKLLLNTEYNQADKKVYADTFIVYATYSALNKISNVQHQYQFELCEKPLVKLPSQYRNKSIVIMDGPFMCLDPYKDTEYHLLGNVVHAIHNRNIGYQPEIPSEYTAYLNKGIIKNPKFTNINRFIESGKKFFSDLDELEHIGSMYTIRTVLPNIDATDARPTLVNCYKFNNEPDEYLVFSGKIGNCLQAANEVINLIKHSKI
jgi:hypothetical protein